MSVTQRWRAATREHEAGAVAVIVAVCAVLLFAVSALVIDIGQVYASRRATQTDADLAALAGAAGLPDPATARSYARDYLVKNLPSNDAPGVEVVPPSESPVWVDGDETNGEIVISQANTRIRVVVPERQVDFGFAGVLPGGGFDNTKVTASATAEIRSPGMTLPFFLSASGASGYSCLKDTSGGGGGPNGSPVRAILLQAQKPPTITSTSPTPLSTAGGETLTVNGSNFRNPNVTSVRIDGVEVTFWTVQNPNRLTLTTPAHAAGNATLAVTNADGTATATITYAAPPPQPAPTVTGITPNSGPQAGGTVVTITGTGFDTATGVSFGSVAAVNPTITNGTTIRATSPPGTGSVHVRVTGPGGTSAESAADEFTYEVDTCGGVNGSYGYLDIPRSTPPLPPGGGAANAGVIINAAAGVDHGWTAWDADKLPAPDTECVVGNTPIAHAILDNGTGVEGANCLDIENGNKTNDVATAFLDGYTQSTPDLDPRLDPPDGHDVDSLHGRSGLDVDHFTDYLNPAVPLATFLAKLASDPVPDVADVTGWIDPEIVQCPRFAIVPVLHVTANPPNGFYPIKEFAAVFVDSPDDDHGFEPNNNGNQIESIHAYAFSLRYLPEVLGSGSTENTTGYVGAGPKVPVLVHDAADPSY